MHNPHVVDLLINSIHVEHKAEVCDGSSHVDRSSISPAGAEFHTNEPTLTEGELVVQSVLCLTSVEWPRVHSEF